MSKLVSDGGEFSCNFCTCKLKLKVLSSSTTGDGKKIANQANCILPPPGGNCTFPPGVPPPPCVGVAPPGSVTKTGQDTVKVDGITALGDGAQFVCPAFGQPVSLSSPGQDVAAHNEASGGAQVASLGLDLIPVVGSIKSAIELILGKDAVTGEEVSRWGSLFGIIPYAKVLTKAKKASKVAKLALKTAAKTEDKAIKEYFVYQSKNVATGKTQYVGITNNIQRRAAEHLKKKGIDINPIDGLPPLTKQQARGVEQALIEIHGKPGGGQLLNKINSISPKNPIYNEQVRRGAEMLNDINYPGAGELLKKFSP